MAEVTLASRFGRAVFFAVRIYRLETVLEIGGCDGDGSTQVILKAMLPLARRKFVCLEIDDKHAENLKKNVASFDWVKPLKESSISWSSFTLRHFERDVWSRHPSSDPEVKKRVYQYWLRDCEQLRTAPQGYLEKHDDFFDGVLLDGGVFTGDDEFRLLRDRTDCFMLDDVFSGFKNARVETELRTDNDWTAVFIDRHERLGTAIYVRKSRRPRLLTKCARLLSAAAALRLVLLKERLHQPPFSFAQ